MNLDTGVHLASNGDYWTAWWWIPGGKRKRKSIGPKTKISKARALAMCRDIQREHTLNPDTVAAGKSPTLGQWRDRYLVFRTDIKETTLELHRITFAKLVDFFGESIRLDKITRANANDWRVSLAESGITESTVCAHVRNAKQFWKWAVNEGATSHNSFDRLRSTAPRKRVRFKQLNEQAVDALIDAAPSPEYRALIALCAHAGLRRNEALALRWTDIQWERNRLHVRTHDGTETTKQRDREVLLEPKLASILLDTREAVDGPLVAPVTGDLHRSMLKVITAAGLQAYSKPFHTLRKNRATSWRAVYPESVVDAWMGHSLQVAREHYAAVPEDYYSAPRAPNLPQSQNQPST